MADNSARVAKMARILAIFQIITGVLLLGFGIADRLVYQWRYYGYYGYYYNYQWTGHGYFGVWIGVWMLITGGLGIPGSGRDRTSSRNAFAGVFMGFSITSAVFGGIIIICYSIAVAQFTSYGYGYYYKSYNHVHSAKLAILAIMLILGIVTFALGIWAAICTCCLMPCACCRQPQFDQPMYPYPAGGYVATQPPGSVPVAAPMQVGGNMAAAQGFHQPVVLAPVGASPEGMATGFPQRWEQQFQPGVEKAPSYTAYQKDQTQVMV